jgi:hypothetical protein
LTKFACFFKQPLIRERLVAAAGKSRRKGTEFEIQILQRGGSLIEDVFGHITFDPTSNAGENQRDISIGRDTKINVRHGVLNASTTVYPPLLCTVSGTQIRISKEFQWWSESNNYWARIADGAQLPTACADRQ